MADNGRNHWNLEPTSKVSLDISGVRLPSGVVNTSTSRLSVVLRTKGKPLTMQTLQTEHGATIAAAAERFEIPEAWIAGMIAIEARRIPKTFHFDPISLRDEDDLRMVDYKTRPHRVSAGLMQTLLSTARSMAKKHDLQTTFAGAETELDLGHLCVPDISITLGTAYMRHQADRYGLDPILIVAAYNAGGVYDDDSNPWNLRTYGLGRIPKFAAYVNDWLSLEP